MKEERPARPRHDLAYNDLSRRAFVALSIGSGPADGIIDANDAVDDRKLGVQAQVDELRSAHGEDSATRAARACG